RRWNPVPVGGTGWSCVPGYCPCLPPGRWSCSKAIRWARKSKPVAASGPSGAGTARAASGVPVTGLELHARQVQRGSIASVHGQRLAGDIAGIVAGEEGDGAGNFLRAAVATQLAARTELVFLVVLPCIVEHPLGHA